VTWKAERVGVVTMTKTGHHFFRKNRVIPSVTAPSDINLGEATGLGSSDVCLRESSQ